MAQDRAQALKDKCVYLDRTVYCRLDQQEKRMQLKAKIIALGGRLVSEVDEADFIFVHLATTTLDRTLASVRDKLISAEYAAHCYEENAILPMHRYRVNLEASPEPRAAESTQLTRRPPEHNLSSAPTPRDQRQTRARARVRTDQLQQSAPAPDAPPIPGFRIPAVAPFSHAPVREWACALARWYATYTPDGTEAVCMRAASACLTKIVPQIPPSSFRNFYDKDPPLRERLYRIVRKARADAERKNVAGLDERRLDALLEDAGKVYADGLARLPGLKTPMSMTEEAATEPLSAPRAPNSVFKFDQGRQKRVTAEGGTYMQHLLRHMLLSGPLRSWDAIEKEAPTASNGLVSATAFRKYRLSEGSAALSKIRDEFERDRDSFRIKFGGVYEASSAREQTPRKRRLSLTQEAGRSTRARGSNGQYVRTGATGAYYAEINESPSSSSGNEDWDYVH